MVFAIWGLEKAERPGLEYGIGLSPLYTEVVVLYNSAYVVKLRACGVRGEGRRG